MAKRTTRNNGTTANLGFEAKLWAAAIRDNLARLGYGAGQEHAR